MKFILLLAGCLIFACSQPRRITFNPDDGAATSGTLGSSKATTQLPKETMDTSGRRDTTLRRRN